MKKLLLLCMIIGLILSACYITGCAKTIYHKSYFDSTGKVTAAVDLTMSRPIFASMSAGANGELINMNSGSSVQLEQLFSMALQGYAKYLSGGLLPTSTVGPTVQSAPAVAVPKPQATPPPAEIPLTPSTIITPLVQ